MVNNHLKQRPIPLIIKGCKSKLHGDTASPIWMATIKKNQNLTSVGEDVEKLKNFCIVGGDTEWYSLYGRLPQKVKDRILYALAFLLLDATQKD